MSDNPFEAPKPLDSTLSSPKDSDQHYYHDGSGRVFVRQVTAIAMLMIVQGVLLAIFGLFCVGYAIFFGHIDSFMPASARVEIDAQLPPDLRTYMIWLLRISAVGSFVLGLLHVFTGIFNLGMHGRMLGITTLLLGIGSAMTCYCALTGIPLSIYGLIIYFNPAVGEAFRLRKTGLSKEQILATFVR